MSVCLRYLKPGVTNPGAVIPGIDQIDIDDNQDIGLIPCRKLQVSGVRVIPFNPKTGIAGGYQDAIEISLIKELPEELVRTDGELEVAFM